MKPIIPIKAFSDNYIWAFECTDQSWAVVDPGDATPVLKWLKRSSHKLSHILLTHHHHDHIGGVAELVRHFPDLVVIGGQAIACSLITHRVQEGFYKNLLPNMHFNVIEIPGHTLDHIAYYNETWLFCGDTLFSLGCGRVFEGTMKQMYDSLEKIRKLDDHLLVFPGHEYTLANSLFAHHLTPDNQELNLYIETLEKKTSNNQPTVPSTLDLEKRLNPFLLTHTQSFIKQLRYNQLPNHPLELFALLRQAKDQF